jgi:hypothetical protein
LGIRGLNVEGKEKIAEPGRDSGMPERTAAFASLS